LSTDSNETLKFKFNQLHQTVVTNVNPASIVDFLFQKAVIGVDDITALEKVKDDPQQQCDELMTLLHTSEHPQAFIHLYAAVKSQSHLQWLVERIDKFSEWQRYISEPTGCVNTCFSEI